MVQGASGERVPHPRLPEEDRVVVSRVKTRDKDLLLRISPPLTRILHLETQSSPRRFGNPDPPESRRMQRKIPPRREVYTAAILGLGAQEERSLGNYR